MFMGRARSRGLSVPLSAGNFELSADFIPGDFQEK